MMPGYHAAATTHPPGRDPSASVDGHVANGPLVPISVRSGLKCANQASGFPLSSATHTTAISCSVAAIANVDGYFDGTIELLHPIKWPDSGMQRSHACVSSTQFGAQASVPPV